MSPAERDEQFRVTYQITAIRSGIIWGRRKLINYIMSDLRQSFKGTTAERRTFVESVIDNDSWMKPRTGMVPAAIARDLFFRSVGQGKFA